MQHHNRISVVIPTFNEGKYIERTLSRLSKIKGLEIIVVDSHSGDETVEIARRFADKVYLLDERGIAKAKNHGALRASGDIIVFLDADVFVPYDFAEKVLSVFHDDVIGATCSIMPLKPKAVERAFFTLYNLLIRLFSSLNAGSLKFSRGEFTAVRKKDFVAVGGFDDLLPCMEDHDLSFRLSKRGRIVFVKDLTVFESMRRVRKWGLFRTVNTWFLDFVFFALFGKTYSRAWSPVR